MLKYLVDPLRPTLEWPAQLKLKCDFGHATVVELSKHRGYIALGTEDGSLIVLDSETVTPQFRYRAHAGRVRAISWSNDAKLLITLGDDWCLCLWDTQQKRVLKTFQLPFNPQAAAFDFDNFNRAALTCGPDLFFAEIPLIDGLQSPSSSEVGLDPKDQPASELKLTQYVAAPSTTTPADYCVVSFVENGCIAAGTNKGQLVFYTDKDTIVRSLKASAGALRALSYNPRARMLAVACSDRAVRVVYFSWAETLDHLEIGHKFSDWGLHSQWNALTFSEDGEYLYAASDMRDGTICIWNALTQTIVRHLKGSNDRLTSLQFNHARTSLLATGRDTGALYVWRAHRPDAWASLIPGFERIADLEMFKEAETSWDLPKDDSGIDLNKRVDIWGIKEPVKEISLPLDI